MLLLMRVDADTRDDGRGQMFRYLIRAFVALGLFASVTCTGGRPVPAADKTGQTPEVCGGFNDGADWEAICDFRGHQDLSLSELVQIHDPIYLPEVPLASSGSVAALSDSGTTAALAYTSGIEVTFTSHPYHGPDAPPFSQASAAANYRRLAAQAGDGMFVDSILGIPVRVIAQNIRGGPGSVYFALGTTDENVVLVSVIGWYSTAELEGVAASIIVQWKQAHPSAGNQKHPPA